MEYDKRKMIGKKDICKYLKEIIFKGNKFALFMICISRDFICIVYI